jgi:hypothetical protein
VYQNQMPNSPSLTELFEDVIRQSKVAPSDISLVEAHGTETAVGDPAEYESIKNAVGGPGIRSMPLPIGSVKGHVGHAEGASGAVSLIKVLMMMKRNFIPPQASFSRVNPGIKASPSDMLEVVTSLRPWSGSTSKKALITTMALVVQMQLWWLLNLSITVLESQRHQSGPWVLSILCTSRGSPLLSLVLKHTAFRDMLASCFLICKICRTGRKVQA